MALILDMIWTSLNVQFPTGKEIWLSFCLIWNDLITSRMVLISSVTVPFLAVGCNPAGPKILATAFKCGSISWVAKAWVKRSGVNSWLRNLSSKSLPPNVSIPAFFNSSMTGCWVVKTTALVFLCTGNGISTLVWMGAAPCS